MFYGNSKLSVSQTKFIILPTQPSPLQGIPHYIQLYKPQTQKLFLTPFFPSHCISNSILSPINFISQISLNPFTSTILTQLSFMWTTVIAQVVTDALRIKKKILFFFRRKSLTQSKRSYIMQPLITSVTSSLLLLTSGPWHMVPLPLLPFYLVNSYLSFRALLKGSFFQEALLSSPDQARTVISFHSTWYFSLVVLVTNVIK